MRVEYRCRSCQWVANPEPLGGACPRCGGIFDINGAASDARSPSGDQVKVRLRNATDGRAMADRFHQNDGRGEIRVSTDIGAPQHIERRDNFKTNGFDAEARAAMTFARWLSRADGKPLTVEPKANEDSDIDDRVLLGPDGARVRRLQFRYLDDSEIASLGATRKFSGERTTDDFVRCVDHAVKEKSLVDADVRASQDLLLLLSHPLGDVMRHELGTRSFELAGYQSVWILSEEEDPLELVRKK
jgi:hypothetical protein